MKKAKSYTIYTSFENSYIKICSISSLYKGNSTFKINVKEYVGTIDKVLENTIDIICKKKGVEFYCNDDSKLLNLRVGFSPNQWSSTTQYVPGDTVYYNGKVYTLKNRTDKGKTPTENDWNASVNYTNKVYIKYDTVLWDDGMYYVANDSIATGENPSNSSKWLKVNGEYTLYCGINGSGSYVETCLLMGEETHIQLYPFTSEIYYTNDEVTTNINGVTISMPRLYDYSNVFISNIKPINVNFNKIIMTWATGETKKYFKIMRIKMVKNTSLFFDIKAENLYMSEVNVFGYCRCSLLGDNNSVNAILNPVSLTSGFSKENINFHVRRLTDGTIDIYVSHIGNRFKLSVEDILDMSKTNTTRYLSSALIEIYNNPTGQDNFNDGGSTLANLYW